MKQVCHSMPVFISEVKNENSTKKKNEHGDICFSINYKFLYKIPFKVMSVFVSVVKLCDILCPQRNFGRHIEIALSVRPSRFRVRSISPIFLEERIPNLVCGYILGWRSVAYHFQVTVTLTLTSDLVFRIIVSGAYLLYYLR